MNTSLFRNTPTVTVRDNRGLTVREIEYQRHPNTPFVTDERITRHWYDLRGFRNQSADPRLHAVGLTNFTYLTDLSGGVLRTQGADNGTTLSLHDAVGRPFIEISNIRTSTNGTDDNSQAVTRSWQYEDASRLGRPLSITQTTPDGVSRIAERLVYAGNTDGEKALNLAGQCVSHYDAAGLVLTDSIALTGASLSCTRRLLKDVNNPDAVADWQGKDTSAWNELLDSETHTTLTTADATVAMMSITDAKGNLQRMTYDVAGLMSGSWLTLTEGAEEVIVKSLMYSADEQKLREEHGNGVVTTYTYEPETQRLIGIETGRPAGHPSGTKVLQDLRFVYDPVGNVLKVSNAAEETGFWRNQEVRPENSYTYDSLYQLVCATGREMANAGRQSSSLPPAIVPLCADSSVYTSYSRTYSYDTAGNLIQIRHGAPATNNNYTTDITVSDRSNRGILSTLTENSADVEALFTAGGQQKQLQRGQSLAWTPRNELRKVTPVVRESGVDDEESYRYDMGGQRILKVSQQQMSGTVHTIRALYLPGLELRTVASGGTETEKLQVMTLGEACQAQVRVLHWESGRPVGVSNNQVRYSHDNLIGSSQLELDGDGKVISVEEYYPYGGTAVLTACSQAEVDYKMVRFSGKERDATGLYYYGYRYYQPWVGRWLSADPAGTVDGINLYRMVRNNPATMRDMDGRAPESGPLRNFSGLEEQLVNESPEIRRKAILGMALANYLIDFGINAKLGGSLVAKLYGAGRAPKDIDIDIGSNDGSSIDTSKYRTKIKFLENKHMGLDVNLIRVESVVERSGVLHIKYKNAVTEVPQEIDHFDEDEQDEQDDVYATLFSNAPVHEEVVDIGTFRIFDVAGLVLGSDPAPHVKPELLIAGFLSRMDADKNDSEQSAALIRHLSLKGKNNAEIEAMVLSHFNKEHANFNKLHDRLKKALSH